MKSFECQKANRQQRVNLNESYRDSLNRMNERLERRIAEEFLGEQAKAVGVGIALWVLPLIALYLLGIGVAWVRKGFRLGI